MNKSINKSDNERKKTITEDTLVFPLAKETSEIIDLDMTIC